MNVGEWLDSGGRFAVVVLLVHGHAGYVHGDCRCEVCTEAKRAYDAAHYRSLDDERRERRRVRQRAYRAEVRRAREGISR